MKWEYFLVPFVISLAMTPLIRAVARKLGLYAKTNERTIHRGQIARVGGVAIFIAFLIAFLLYVEVDKLVLGIILGSSIIFITGLVDDVFDIKAFIKLALQIASALVVIYVGGISLEKFNLPFGLTITNTIVLDIITFIWIVGVTNAINLIDGLDGLAAGICLIVLTTLFIIASNFSDVSGLVMAVIMMGALGGFLPFNFNPASIFLGDCGAQFLGFLMACITLVSFKSTAFITMLLPFSMLFVPLMDSLLAIIRRKSSGKKITDADKSHLHHILMFDLQLGHRRTVLVLYAVTAIFGATAYLYRYDQLLGSIVLLALILIFEIFIEYTGMINTRYRPILTLFKRIAKNIKDE